VSRRRTTEARQSSQVARKGLQFALDPYFACLLFAGVGLGTLGLPTSPRLIVLWLTLLGLWLAYRQGGTVRVRYEFGEVGRGLVVGLVIGVPLVAIAFRSLSRAVPILYVSREQAVADAVTGSTVFTSLVLLAPLAEELFFRDVLQRERGFWMANALYAVAILLFFLPTAGEYPVVLVAVSGAAAVLGIIYGFLHERLGFAVALSCHATVNLILLWIPTALSHLDLFAR
jgi:membrane protease YdiL (CAAX protease family)